jgi:hypothetical protein
LAFPKPIPGCGALLFSKPMTFLNGLGVVISLLGVISYTVVSRCGNPKLQIADGLEIFGASNLFGASCAFAFGVYIYFYIYIYMFFLHINDKTND